VSQIKPFVLALFALGATLSLAALAYLFVVFAPLLTVGAPVQLPVSEATQPQTEPMTIRVRADGAILLQNEVVTDDELIARMDGISNERVVYVRADTAASWELVSGVMARIGSAGFRNVALVTDTEDRVRGGGE
jgi:biopolymer transport protein TolR